MIQLNWGLKRTYRRFFPRLGISAPIAVHSIPKTGSTSIWNGLRALKLDVPVYHTHFAGIDFEKKAEEIRRTVKAPKWPLSQLAQDQTAWEHFERWRDSSRNRPWNLIGLVRNPIDRQVSHFFYTGYRGISQRIPDLSDRLELCESDIHQIQALFLERFKEDDPDWFDNHLHRPFGIDVYASPFPKETGYAIYEGPKVRLLLIRMEDLDRLAPEAFQRFLGLRNFRPDRANTAESSHYKKIYQQFKREVCLPESYLDRASSSKLARHFYTDEELQRFKERWLRTTPAPA